MSDSLPLSELKSSPSISFENVGDRVAGVIESVSRKQQTHFETGELLSWSNGDPRMLTFIVIRKDDGEEGALYARGGSFEVASGEGTSLEGAIVEAAIAAGATALEKGARLEVVHSGLSKRVSGKNPAKLYRAKYTPATAAVPLSDLFTPSET